jgi:type IX secretion system PorP/SprF family membrane protein
MSFDFCKEKLPIDIGIFYLNDRAGGVTIRTNQVGLSLGRSFRMFKNVSLRIGFSGALTSRKLDISNLTFGDPSDPIINSPLLSVNYALINFGMVMHSNRFLFGISASNLNEPDQGFFGGQSRLPLKYTLQGALRINMNDIENLSGVYISGIYINQQDFNTYLPGIIYRYKFIRAGLAYRYKDAFIVNAAYSGKNLSIGYSYDYTVSKLTNQTGGSHEFTINWTFGKLNEKRPGIGFISSLF